MSFGTDDRREIVGIVEDVQSQAGNRERVPQFYLPMTDEVLGSVDNLMIRTSRSLASVRGDIVAAVKAFDPDATGSRTKYP